jgi:hypothetical protein
LKITIEEIDGWYDWIVEGDRNSRGPYCGGARILDEALDSIADTVRSKKRHPYNPRTRTEY